jgi:glycosyltransferase involved in cell wall biosynthesis
MRVCLINEYFPPFAPGGAEWSTLQLAKGLAGRGHRVAVVTPNYGGLAPREDLDGFSVHRFPFPVKMKGTEPVATRCLGNPLFYLYSACRILQVAKAEKLSVLHAQNKFSMPGTWMAARALGLRALVTIRDTIPLCPLAICLQDADNVAADCDLLRRYWRCASLFYDRYVGSPSWARRVRFLFHSVGWQRLDLAFRRFVLARMDRAVFITNGIRAVYASAARCNLPATEVIYNLPPPLAEPIPFNWDGRHRGEELRGRRIVLYVGKQSSGKGTPDLIAAVPRLIESVPDAMFLFVGRGNAEDAVSPRLRKHVVQWSPLPNPQVLSLMREVTMAVLPSAAPEAQGRVLLEAMRVGVPVVATRVGGIPETVEDGVTGILVDRHDVAGLGDAMLRLLTDPDLARRMGASGRVLLNQRFDPCRSLDRLEALYTELLTERR